MAAIQMVAASPTRPRVVVRLLQTLQPPPPTLVDHFVTKNGINEPSVKTNSLPDCYRRNMGGPFFMGLALARTAHTGIGRRSLTICGRMSMRHSSSSRPLTPARKRLPAANGPLTSTLLELASRRPPARMPFALLNIFFTSAPPTNVRWRLHVANASLTRRLLVADAPLRHGRRWPPEHQTSRRLQREATLARMQHDQECCVRALQAEEQR